MRKLLAILAAVVLFIALVIGLYLASRPHSLAGWIALVQRPHFKILYSSQIGSRYWAIFDTGDGQLAVCSSQHGSASSMRVTNGNGEEIDDPHRKSTALQRESNFGIKYRPDGISVPIRPEFTGRIRVVLREVEPNNSGDFDDADASTVLDVVVPWRQEDTVK